MPATVSAVSNVPVDANAQVNVVNAMNPVVPADVSSNDGAEASHASEDVFASEYVSALEKVASVREDLDTPNAPVDILEQTPWNITLDSLYTGKKEEE